MPDSPPQTRPSEAEAARFLTQASFGPTTESTASVKLLGYDVGRPLSGAQHGITHYYDQAALNAVFPDQLRFRSDWDDGLEFV